MDTVCRLCLKDDQEQRPSHDDFPEVFSDLSVEQLILQYLPIQIIKTEDSEYPFICSDCTSRITQWHQFCTSCIENDKIYQERLFQQLIRDERIFIPQEVPIQLKEEATDISCEDPAQAGQCLAFELEFESVEMGEEIDAPEVNFNVKQESATLDSENCEQDTKLNSPKKKSKGSKKLETTPKKPCKPRKRPPRDKNLPPKRIGRPRTIPEGEKHHHRSEMCPICGKFVKVLKEHLRVHNDDRKYLCPYCPKTFVALSSYRSHVNIHTKEKLHKCDHCDKTYFQRNSLKSHMATHTKDRKFVCPVCDKAFYQSTALSRHKRTHFQEPKVKCTECDHKTYSQGEMRLHMRKHLPRTFACEICGSAFYRNSNLKVHLKTHRKQKTDSCSVEDAT